MNTIFIDLETHAGDKPDISELKVPGNISKPESIEKWKNDPANLEEAWRRQALDVLQCQVVCISYAINDGKVYCVCQGDEKSIMTQFVQLIQHELGFQKNIDTLHWVAHNGLSFDYPILWHRLKKYKLANIMPPMEAKNQLLDTMKLAGYSDYKSMLSLKKLAKFYGIECGDDSGKDVHDLYLAGKLEEIADHCAKDVDKLRKLYNILK